jgi:CheY-like chemotaxis protein
MKKKILVVEDNPDSREILGLILQRMGHDVIKAQNSKEAITCSIADHPDLIFMDLGLPDLDGVDTTAELKRNPDASHIPVVGLSAWCLEIWKKKAMDAGMVAFLTKPAPTAVLQEVIERFTQSPIHPLSGTFQTKKTIDSAL